MREDGGGSKDVTATPSTSKSKVPNINKKTPRVTHHPIIALRVFVLQNKLFRPPRLSYRSTSAIPRCLINLTQSSSRCSCVALSACWEGMQMRKPVTGSTPRLQQSCQNLPADKFHMQKNVIKVLNGTKNLKNTVKKSSTSTSWSIECRRYERILTRIMRVFYKLLPRRILTRPDAGFETHFG